MIKRTYKLGDVVRLTSSGGFYSTYGYAHKYFNVKNIRPYESTTELIVPLDYKTQNWVVIGKVIPVISISWKLSLPIRSQGTLPVIATIGTESSIAVAIPVTRFVAPGPEVAITTPVLPVALKYPSAACDAPCSWAVNTWSIRSLFL